MSTKVVKAAVTVVGRECLEEEKRVIVGPEQRSDCPKDRQPKTCFYNISKRLACTALLRLDSAREPLHTDVPAIPQWLYHFNASGRNKCLGASAARFGVCQSRTSHGRAQRLAL